ncbi:LytR/AlgR family response regulator transcription factor [Pedobacter cryophilus]|uniref:Response regulator transcription factor n=1 Tax=Pedobacter cryophilus TaxID=2571271 RepID=A0A4U1C5M9_9SPHI|nr:LytTR family DNA-binding domain-containing protein [Pedobacter cryophilus]TKB98650.1 response regulator transcription factor [Pedobacter cryophilus]
MFNCFIVDDEPASLEIISDYISETPHLFLQKATTNPRDILPLITAPGKNQITFLDIDMPGINGLELASLIQGHTAVIFITSYPNYAIQAFEKDAYDYLLKPISYARFLQAVIKVKSRLQTAKTNYVELDNQYFLIKGNKQGEIIKIYYQDLLYIESLHNYVSLHTLQGKYIAYFTLKELEYKLNKENFVKIHKSYLINIDKMSTFQYHEVQMENGAKLPVGSACRAQLQMQLNTKLLTTDRRANKKGDH